MTCDDVRDALALVAVGDDEPVTPQVVHHLALCEPCMLAYRRYLATMGRLLDAVTPVAPPERLRSSVLERALSEGRESNGRSGADVYAPVDDPRSQTVAAPRPGRHRPAGRRRFRAGWAVAALLLGLLNIGLLWDGWSTRAELTRLEAGVGELRAELEETWNAFAGAPAVYAGALEFQVAEGFRQGTSAQGYLYARPNGWAVLFRIAGLESAGDEAYDVWFDTGAGWERRGVLRVGADGVAAWLHYAREPEMTLRRVHVAAVGALPGTPEWVSQAVASARVRSVADSVHDEFIAW